MQLYELCKDLEHIRMELLQCQPFGLSKLWSTGNMLHSLTR